jgi:hypothetical protein
VVRQKSINADFGFHPRASASSPQRSSKSPRCSAAGVIFAWQNEAAKTAIPRCQKIGRLGLVAIA